MKVISNLMKSHFIKHFWRHGSKNYLSCVFLVLCIRVLATDDVAALMALIFIRDVGFVMFLLRLWSTIYDTCGQSFTTQDHGTHMPFYELTLLVLGVSPVDRAIVPLQVLSGTWG